MVLRRISLVGLVVLAACNVQRVQTSRSVTVDDHMSHMNATDLRAPSTPRSVSSNQQGVAGLPPSAATAPARLSASPRHGEWVKIAFEQGSADSMMAWIVYPVARTKAPVVVVVHEIFGLQTWVRGVADQVAADGFIAIAPDFLSRVRRGGPSNVELHGDTARAMIGGVGIPERNRIIAAAASYAMMQASAEQKYAVIGYCWGGQTVWGHAVNGGVKGYSGGVAYYGAFPYTAGGQRATATAAAVPASIVTDSLLKINTPLMLLNGSGDARIAASMPALDSIMKRNKKDYVGINYPGAIHGFLRAQDDPPTSAPADAAAFEAQRAANLAATKDGWPKTIAFLRKNLGVK